MKITKYGTVTISKNENGEDYLSVEDFEVDGEAAHYDEDKTTAELTLQALIWAKGAISKTIG
jgi:hypothetical protein